MCGIGGILGSVSQDKINYITHDMKNLLHHRGPDGNGIIVLKKDFKTKLAFVHTRLSIIDLDKSANQPMSYENRFWITYNGEIYNYQEIRNELISSGFEFNTKSDSEVILAAYSRWGINAFSKFIGMWALAIWDDIKKELVLSRDRMGIKPLYYSFENNFLVFSSSPHLVSKYILNKNKLKKSSLTQYLSYRHQIDNTSFFQDVFQVEPGTNIIFKNNKKIIKPYWSIPEIFKKNKCTEVDIMKTLDEYLNSSVQYRMVSDVSVGSFLSGGLDSSILVWYMTQLSNIPVNTFSIGFQDKYFNEFYFSNIVSKELKTNHKSLFLEEYDYINSLNHLIKHKGSPLTVPNEIGLFKLTQDLYKNDNKVILSGEGADEVFGGYGKIFSSEYDYSRMLAKTCLKNNKLTKNFLLQYGTVTFDNEIDHFLRQYTYVPIDLQLKIYSKDFYSDLNEDPFKVKYFSDLIKNMKNSSLSEKYMWLFQKIHIQGLLGRLDNATMANSIEGRVPFLDHRLIEFMNGIPLKMKIKMCSNFSLVTKNITSNEFSERFNETKYILRKLFKNRLPNEITDRKKVGFPVPLANWMDSKLKYIVLEELSSTNSSTKDMFSKEFLNTFFHKKTFSSKDGLIAWMLLNFEYWMREFKVSY